MDSTPGVDLGDDVWLVDTQMGGFDGITAGYLIRGERPCLVEAIGPRAGHRVYHGTPAHVPGAG